MSFVAGAASLLRRFCRFHFIISHPTGTPSAEMQSGLSCQFLLLFVSRYEFHRISRPDRLQQAALLHGLCGLLFPPLLDSVFAVKPLLRQLAIVLLFR